MVLASLLALAGDLAVSGLVVTASATSRCLFNTSGPYTVMMQNSRPDITIEPGPFGANYQMLSQARLTSLNNGGLGGIYGKVNGDPTFRADSSDVVGQWNCQDLGEDISFPMNASYDDIQSDLTTHGLLFNEYSWGCFDHHGDNINGRFLVWSFSGSQQVGAQLTTPWDVKIAVDMTSDAYASSQVLSTYLCQMDALTLNDIVMQTSVDWWFSTWCQELRGHIYTDFASSETVSTDPGAVMESLLDTLVMTAGSAWNLTQFPISDPMQGCLVVMTNVSWVVVALVVVVTIITSAMTGYLVGLSVLVHGATRQGKFPPEQVKAIVKDTPDKLLDWMLQAVREAGYWKVKNFRDLGKYSFEWRPDRQRMGLVETSRVGANPFGEDVVLL
jgi:hypothetical protein